MWEIREIRPKKGAASKECNNAESDVKKKLKVTCKWDCYTHGMKWVKMEPPGSRRSPLPFFSSNDASPIAMEP
jgi:hypothetical protein